MLGGVTSVRTRELDECCFRAPELDECCFRVSGLDESSFRATMWSWSGGSTSILVAEGRRVRRRRAAWP